MTKIEAEPLQVISHEPNVKCRGADRFRLLAEDISVDVTVLENNTRRVSCPFLEPNGRCAAGGRHSNILCLKKFPS